jgi:hypothetical protein
MPYLFCEEHGPEHEITAQEEQDYLRFLGETIVIVSGPLKSPSWRCTRCHARLRRGCLTAKCAAVAYEAPKGGRSRSAGSVGVPEWKT